jgi:hypothetical protein
MKRGMLAAALSLCFASGWLTVGCGSTAAVPGAALVATPAITPSPTPNPAPPTVNISVLPTFLTLNAGDSQQFVASVTGPTDQSVTWLVNGAQGGSAATGIVSVSGLYVAPQTDSPLVLAVTARSNFDPTHAADANVTVNPPPPPNPSASDFYVSTTGSDTNSGTSAKPWKTINHAAAAIKAGATVHVAAGEYDGNVTTTVSGTSSARIRYISDVQGAAHIVGGTGEEAWLNRGDYVDIMGFDVTGGNPNGIVNLGSNVRILGNIVHDILARCDSIGGSGIDNASYTAHDNDIGGNFVHDVLNSAGCTHPNAVGIYQSDLRGHVYNNISVHNGTQGIQLWHASSGAIVANNTVINNGDDGIVVGAGDAPGGVTNDNTIVVNNIVVGNTPYGIEEFGNTGPNNRYLNNIVFGNASANLKLLTGVAAGTIVADPQFVNNTADAGGDYHLGAKSPAVDGGISANAPTTDFVGGTRPQGRAVDIGAYESGAAAGKWPWQ